MHRKRKLGHKMYWKRLKPFIKELVIFVLIAAFEIFGSFFRQFIPVLMAAFIIWMIVDFNTFVPFSLRVILDYLMEDYITQKAVFVEQFPRKRSAFQDKTETHVDGVKPEKRQTVYYTIIIKFPTWNDTLTSSEYFELKPNTLYEFTYGKRSKALVDVKEVLK